MSDVTCRLSRWKAKYSPKIAAQTTARIYADMTERYQASMVALCTMETETKQVLDGSGIDTMYIVFYLGRNGDTILNWSDRGRRLPCHQPSP